MEAAADVIAHTAESHGPQGPQHHFPRINGFASTLALRVISSTLACRVISSTLACRVISSTLACRLARAGVLAQEEQQLRRPRKFRRAPEATVSRLERVAELLHRRPDRIARRQRPGPRPRV